MQTTQPLLVLTISIILLSITKIYAQCGENNSLIPNGEFNQSNGSPYTGDGIRATSPPPWNINVTPDISTDDNICFDCPNSGTPRTSLFGFQSSPQGGSFMGFRSNEGIFNNLTINNANRPIVIRFFYTEYLRSTTATSSTSPNDPGVNIVFRLNATSHTNGTLISTVDNLSTTGGTQGTWEVREITFVPANLGISSGSTVPFYLGSQNSVSNVWAFVDGLRVFEEVNLNFVGPQCNDNNTPSDPTDDFATFTLDPSRLGSSGSYTVTPSAGTVTPSPASYGSVTTFAMQPGSANGSNISITVRDSDGSNCVLTESFSQESCSPECALADLNITNIQCNDNDTPADPSDDFISFDMNPTGTNIGSTYNVSSTDPSGITPNSGTYGTVTRFQLSLGTADGSTNYTITVTDQNDSQCQLSDNIGPVGSCSPVLCQITCPPDQLLPCNGDTSVASNGMAEPVSGTDISRIWHRDFWQEGTCEDVLTRRWYGQGICDEIDSCDQTIILRDMEAPVFANDNSTIESSCTHTMPDATVTDNCGLLRVDTIIEELNRLCPNTYIQQVTFIAFDNCLLSDTLTYTLEVVDNEPPVFIEESATIRSSCTSSIPGYSLVTDNCGILRVDTIIEELSRTCPNTYTQQVMYIAFDSCMNADTLTYTLEVTDNEPPVLEAGNWDMTITSQDICQVEPYRTADEIQFATGRAVVDNCGGPIDVGVREELIPANECGPRTVRRYYSFRDVCDNVSTEYVQDIVFDRPCQELNSYGNISINGETKQYLSAGCFASTTTVETEATGVCGYLEFMWLMSTEEKSPGVPFIPTEDNLGNIWHEVPNETMATISPGVIEQNTYFVRCVRNFTCCEFQESNIVAYLIDDNQPCPPRQLEDDCDSAISIMRPTHFSNESMHYKTNETIDSDVIIEGSSNIEFNARNGSGLYPGFEVRSGSELQIKTEGCQ